MTDKQTHWQWLMDCPLITVNVCPELKSKRAHQSYNVWCMLRNTFTKTFKSHFWPQMMNFNPLLGCSRQKIVTRQGPPMTWPICLSLPFPLTAASANLIYVLARGEVDSDNSFDTTQRKKTALKMDLRRSKNKKIKWLERCKELLTFSRTGDQTSRILSICGAHCCNSSKEMTMSSDHNLKW